MALRGRSRPDGHQPLAVAMMQASRSDVPLLRCDTPHGRCRLRTASAFEFALTGAAWIVASAFLLGGVLGLYGAPTATRLTRSSATIR
jgi:hypothetical protein